MNSKLESVLVIGAKIKIGEKYAAQTGYKPGEIIELVKGVFEIDDGFGTVQTAPSVWNEEQKEYDSIYHLFENDLSLFMDCEVIK